MICGGSRVLAIGFILLAGCTREKIRQDLFQGIYDGCRMEEKLMTPPYERLGTQDMDFQQYTKARKERSEDLKK
jgi:hypothetical protein